MSLAIPTNKSPFLKSYQHKDDANTHFTILSPLQNRNTLPVKLHTQLCHFGLWTNPVRVASLLSTWADRMGGLK